MAVSVSRGATMFMHKETGTVATQADWEASYAKDELDERGMTATQAFFADLGVTLFMVNDTGLPCPVHYIDI